MIGAQQGAHDSERGVKKAARIAVIVNHHEDMWDRNLISNVKKLIASSKCFAEKPQFDIYSPNNNPSFMRSDIAWKLTKMQDKIDLIITSGPWISVAIMATQRHWRRAVPHIFVGVDDPTGWGLTDNDYYSENGVTGIKTLSPRLQNHLKAMSNLRPNARRAVIFYNGDLDKMSETSFLQHSGVRGKLSGMMRSAGWSVEMVGLRFNSDVEDEVFSKLIKADVAVMLNESTVMMHQEKLHELCTQARTTLVGLNVLSVIKGAAFGTGSSGADCAPLLVKQIRQILVEKRDPSDVEIVGFQEPDRVWYNPLEIENQGVYLKSDDTRLRSLHSVLSGEVL